MHFFFGFSPQVRRLKKNVVPSCNLPPSSVPGGKVNTNLDAARLQRRLNRCNRAMDIPKENSSYLNKNKKLENVVDADCENAVAFEAIASSVHNVQMIEMGSSSAQCNIEEHIFNTDFSLKSKCDRCTQVMFDDLKPSTSDVGTQITISENSIGSFIDSLKTDENLSICFKKYSLKQCSYYGQFCKFLLPGPKKVKLKEIFQNVLKVLKKMS